MNEGPALAIGSPHIIQTERSYASVPKWVSVSGWHQRYQMNRSSQPCVLITYLLLLEEKMRKH